MLVRYRLAFSNVSCEEDEQACGVWCGYDQVCRRIYSLVRDFFCR